MKVFVFHLMPYAYVDPDYDQGYKTCWVTYPNTNFDPVKGYELYIRYLDGICVNEHHQNGYGLMPPPVCSARTSRSRQYDVKI